MFGLIILGCIGAIILASYMILSELECRKFRRSIYEESISFPCLVIFSAGIVICVIIWQSDHIYKMGV